MDFTPYTCAEIGGEDGLNGPEGTDIDHIVALAEAHDSGLGEEGLLRFSGDPTNLTLATPYENRTTKNDRDPADYLPEYNQCWFVGRVLAVKQKWGLSVDSREAQFLKTALAECTAAEIAQPTCASGGGGGDDDDDDDNGGDGDGGGGGGDENGGSGGDTAPNHPPIQTYQNCAAMRSAGWHRGVNRNGGTYEDAWDDAERQTYHLNTGRDGDGDGHACE